MGPTAHVGLADYYPLAFRRLVGTLRVMGVPTADASEVAQEAFVRLIPRWDTVRDYDSPDGWLRTVAWRIWLNDRRRDRHLSDASWSEAPLDEPGRGSRSGRPDTTTGVGTARLDPRAESDAVDLRTDLVAALAALPEGHREVVALHYLLDLPVARIADELGIAEGTVKSRLSRARALLAQALTLEEVSDD